MEQMTEAAFELHLGDCLDALRVMPDNSVDSIVTDPPYGLSLMGKRWDYDVPGVEVWAECLRVLKPGGHLLAFAGARTQHRMAVRIDDAGFEIRDMIAWVYGSGFPKSRDVSDAMARHLAGERPVPATSNTPPAVYQVTSFLRNARDKAGWTNRQIDALFGTNGMAGHWTTAASQPAVPSLRQWEILKASLGFGDELDHLVAELAATERPESDDTERAGRFLESLREKHGKAGPWGTGIKPALEPITVARKPPKGSVAANVLAHGVGALNLGACRIGDEGRWPANLIHDGSDEVAGLLGDAARFFYCPKASKRDREESLDGFAPMVAGGMSGRQNGSMGSGSTGKAAALEGFRFVGCELSADYLEIARARIQHANDNRPAMEVTA